MTGQLVFDLPAQAAYRREGFFASPSNVLALNTLAHWRGWPGGKMILVGPRGAGKTHLAHIWATDAEAVLVAASDLDDTDLPALAAVGAVCIEDAEAVAGQPARESALFHLHNLLAECRGALLLTCATPPRDWGMALPDLASRMQAATLTRLDPPDDALLAAVLEKLFADRQIAVPPTLIPYLISRMDRSFDAARDLVARLDTQALAEGRAVTRPLAAKLLDSATGSPD
ncbi:MAG: DnaA/Hda family protein [Paracoccaceae bacterium]|nr:DnaA/Hda family protein [Paracoccaceae bacterium]